MKLLVTGATGFIGGALCKRLGASGQVHGLVRSLSRGARLADFGVQAVQGDLLDPASLIEACRGCEAVVHAAAWVGAEGEPAVIEAVNVGGTRALLEAARKAGVRRFVHISSTGVYGAPEGLDVDESTPMRLSGLAYHDSKVQAEELVRDAQGLQTLRLRPSHVWGPGSTHFTLRPLRMLLKGPVPLVAGGRFHFKPLHIDNLVDAVQLSLKPDAPSGLALNLTDGGPRSWRELFEAYAQACSIEARYRSIPLPLARLAGRLGDAWTGFTGRKAPLSGETVKVLSSANSYSNALAQRELGWSPRVGWEQGMREVGDWLQELGPERLLEDTLPPPLEVL